MEKSGLLDAKKLFPDVENGDHKCNECTYQDACSVFILLGIAETVRLGQPEIAFEGAKVLQVVQESWIERRKNTPDVVKQKTNPNVGDPSDEEFEKIPESSFFKA